MKCLILAAGYATRLYPLTENFPKPLLQVGEKKILDWLVDDIHTSGLVDEYIVISNHKFYDHFVEWAKTKSQKIQVLDDGTTSNETRLGAVCDIWLAMEKLHIEEEVFVIAGDNVLDFSLCRFLAYAKEKGSSSIMRYYEASLEKLKKCGVVKIDQEDLVLNMTEKSQNPESHWCCPPFYYYLPEDVKRIPEAIEDGVSTDAPGSLVSWLCKKSKVYAMEMPGQRYDIGNLESYEKIGETYKGIQ